MVELFDSTCPDIHHWTVVMSVNVRVLKKHTLSNLRVSWHHIFKFVNGDVEMCITMCVHTLKGPRKHGLCVYGAEKTEQDVAAMCWTKR